MMKSAVIYVSKTGTTREMAEVIAEGMMSVGGVEAQTYAIGDIDSEWVKESSCIVIGTPIYMANMCGEMKLWLERECRNYGVAGKIGGAFATADYVHGGGELGIQTILDHLLVLGMLTYSGGGACGKPVIHLGPVAMKGRLDESRETFRLYGQRMAAKAAELFK